MFYSALTFLSVSALGQTYSEQELETLVLVREADLGVERIYLDQFEYYYELPQSLETPEFFWDGALLWRYEDQAVFTDAPNTEERIMQWVEPDYVLTGLDYDSDAYFGVGIGKRVDNYGRRWVLDYVDVDLARHARIKYNESILNMFPDSMVGTTDNPGIEYNPEAGLEYTAVPTSWNVIACSGDQVYWDHSSNGDLVQSNPTPMNSRQRKIVWLASHGCTGVMVENSWVLTAAHCVTDDDGEPVSANEITVCSMENLDENTVSGHEAMCIGAEDVIPSPFWDGFVDTNSESAEDYAVVHLLTSTLDAFGNGWFALTDESDGVITGPDDYVRGYPGYKRNCTANSTTTGVADNDGWSYGRHMHMADGEVQGTPTGWVKWDTSVAKGVSGGPHFFCPTGDCDQGHYVTGVQSSITPCLNPPCSTGFAMGPKASTIRDWVINQTPVCLNCHP